MSEFKYVSLFSGIGGFETALNRLGGECVLSSEIDKYANRAYEVLYGHETAGDVTKINAEDVPDHDVLVGGFPCQAFSIAGNRMGFDDTRGTLFFEIARIAKVKQPKLLLLENVKGLLSHDKGNTLDTIIGTLSDLGYAVDLNVMNSKFFGVPQNRERVFIVASRDAEPTDWTPANIGVVAKAKSRLVNMGVRTFNFPWPEQTSVDVKLRDILEPHVAERFYLSDEKASPLLERIGELEPIESIGEIRIVGRLEAINGHDICKRVYGSDGISPTIPTGSSGNTTPKIIVQQVGVIKNLGVISERDIATCIDANYACGWDNHGQRIRVLEGQKPFYRIRKLTPLECFRLQGFPDDYYYRLKEAGISNSQLYKMAGNAVTVNVIEAISRNLIRLK